MGDTEKMGNDPGPSNPPRWRLLEVFRRGAQAGENPPSALMHSGCLGSNSGRDIGATGRPIEIGKCRRSQEFAAGDTHTPEADGIGGDQAPWPTALAQCG